MSLHQFSAFSLISRFFFFSKNQAQTKITEDYRSVFFPYSLYALIVYNMAFETALSICCLKSWILLYERKIQHSGIVNLIVVTVRWETARNLRPFMRPAFRRTLVTARFWTTLTSASSSEWKMTFLVVGEFCIHN